MVSSQVLHTGIIQCVFLLNTFIQIDAPILLVLLPLMGLMLEILFKWFSFGQDTQERVSYNLICRSLPRVNGYYPVSSNCAQCYPASHSQGISRQLYKCGWGMYSSESTGARAWPCADDNARTGDWPC